MFPSQHIVARCTPFTALAATFAPLGVAAASALEIVAFGGELPFRPADLVTTAAFRPSTTTALDANPASRAVG